ncbi:MAG: histidine kinase [Clostridiaceae bacterium]
MKKVIIEIGSSRELIYKIVDNARSNQERLEKELFYLKNDLGKVIDEVDYLEKQDKLMRKKLAKVSSNFKIYTEKDIKEAYEKASDVRIKYLTKQNEEKNFKDKRYQLEIALKKSIQSIEEAEKIINQVSIALGYLEMDVLSVLEKSEKNSQMFMGIKILEAQENERKRIARDIHDGPAQHMANVIMKADICKVAVRKDLERGINELSDLKVSVKLALKEVRGIIFDLRPMSLDDLGLNEAINQNIKALKNDTNITVDLKLKPVNEEIEPIIQVALYRIMQEILNNIKKHSNASHLEIKLDYGTKYLMLIVSDNGNGFNVEETINRVKNEGNSYGLIGILDRVKQLYGEINIISNIGEGTIYKVKLPTNREVMKNGK